MMPRYDALLDTAATGRSAASGNSAGYPHPLGTFYRALFQRILAFLDAVIDQVLHRDDQAGKYKGAGRQRWPTERLVAFE